MRIRALRLLTIAILLLSACGKETTEAGFSVFKRIIVEGSQWTLEQGGSVEISFIVEDAEYEFNYTVGSPDCQIGIFSQSGETAFFRLTKVVKGPEKGHYTATLSDLGVEDYYIEKVSFSMRVYPGTDRESLILSEYFTLTSDAAASGRIPVRTGLPVVYLETAGPIASKEEYVSGSLSIRGGDYNMDDVQCNVRGRGNTTWTWPKKPYLIKLDEKQGFFGMHRHKRWILLANFMDKTLMRNIVAMKVSSMTSLDWTPGCVSVELVLNGTHVGNYLLIEQVRVDNHRVDITEMTGDDNSGEAVTGGYLLELDFHFDNEVQWKDPHGQCVQWINDSNQGIPFGVKYPDPDDITPSQKDYIRKYIYEAAEAIYGDDFKDPEKGYAKYIDVDSFIDYWLVFEVMGNHELSNPGSVFMHKDRGGKLVAGPVWDFDWGVLSYTANPGTRTGLVNGKAIWYARLFEDPAFKARVKARFEELRPQLETIPAYIDETAKMLEKSASLNFKMWNPAQDASMNGGRIINGDENMSFSAAVKTIKEIFEDRLTVIPANL